MLARLYFPAFRFPLTQQVIRRREECSICEYLGLPSPPPAPCLYYRACALTVTMIEYTCLHEQQWCVCWWLNPIQSLVKSVRHYIPGGRYLSSASHTSSLDISSKTSFMSCTVSSGFLFSMISRTVFAQVEEVPIRCSFLSGILNFSPSFCQCLK